MKIKKAITHFVLGCSLLALQPNISFASLSTPQDIIKRESFIEDPNDFTKVVGDKLFKSLKDRQSEIKSNPNVLKEKEIVKKDVLSHSNVKYTGSQILSNYYNKFSSEQREKFFTVLEKYLATNYGQVFTLYKNQTIKYVPTPYNNEKVVKTRVDVITNAASPVKIYFSLRQNSKTNEWQIYDIVAEGISFIQSKKTEWSSYFNKGDIEGLIQDLEKASQSNIVFSSK